MRAAVFQGPGLLHEVETLPMPKPGPHQMLVEVERCGICGSDLANAKARTSTASADMLLNAIYRPGMVLGHEIAGRVVELGAKVERFRIGDRIAPMAFSGCSLCAGCRTGNPLWCTESNMMMGGYGQFALAGEFHSAPLPAGLSIDAGALVEPMATSLHAVALAEILSGARVVVLGAGALGLGIVHFARAAGAGSIAAIARTASREPLARALGADIYLTQRPGLAGEVAEAMGGPADVVFEAAGATGLIGQAIDCVRPRGTIVTAGIPTGTEPNFHLAATLKEVRIQYSTAYTVSDFAAAVDALRDPDSPLEKIVSDSVSLDDFPGVFAALCDGAPHTKVLVDPWKATN